MHVTRGNFLFPVYFYAFNNEHVLILWLNLSLKIKKANIIEVTGSIKLNIEIFWPDISFIDVKYKQYAIPVWTTPNNNNHNNNLHLLSLHNVPGTRLKA